LQLIERLVRLGGSRGRGHKEEGHRDGEASAQP
jgi:hypothetical protein